MVEVRGSGIYRYGEFPAMRGIYPLSNSPDFKLTEFEVEVAFALCMAFWSEGAGDHVARYSMMVVVPIEAA